MREGRELGRLSAVILCAIAALTSASLWAVAGSFGAMAQNPGRPAASSPLGNPSWSTDVKPESTIAGIALDPKQIETVNKVSRYFNNLENLRGTFVQTSSDNKRMRGTFFVKRPGRLRFEYNRPSRQLIVSDGTMLAIQDLEVHTDDRIALEQTPFRLLLRKDVDLLRDASIIEVQEADDLIILALQDKSPDAPGQIRLFLTKGPELELREWVTTDSQGTDTRVEVANLARPDDLDLELFRVISPALRKQQ
ncbi:MAG TPA: outer membrane lipoprotein carrier protein LolA [Hyphomicrobiaceae bacterium]|nr:outer membrane lipoprotein carrier protein LolA [Hyphomicrobiaceae bacterium]